MTSHALDKFSSLPPRETSGSSSSNRFDYQKNWSICHFLELHQDGKDYLIVFDHHEDIVVFNHSTAPDSACFYQVKSKNSGNWTVAGLAKRKGDDHETSILRKLYSNYERFPEFALKLAFISNQRLSVKDKNSGKKCSVSGFCFDDLHNDDKSVCSNALEAKNKKFSNLSGLKLFEFERTLLTIDDHINQTKGKISEFFEHQFPTETVNVGLAFRAIFDEVRRKTNFERTDNSPKNVLEEKSLSREQFQSMLAVMVGQRSNAERWVDASQILLSEGCNGLSLRSIRNAWNQQIIYEMDSNNEQFLAVFELVKSTIEGAAFDSGTTILSLAKEICGNLESADSEVFDTSAIAAMICREVTKNEPLQKVSAKSEEKDS